MHDLLFLKFRIDVISVATGGNMLGIYDAPWPEI